MSILLHQDGKVLMLKRAHEPFKDYWVLPGGFISYEETAEVAVRREAQEEIGTNIIIEGIIGTYLIDDDPRGMHLDIIFFGTVSGPITRGSEFTDLRYFTSDNLPQNIAYKHRAAITDWYKNTH